MSERYTKLFALPENLYCEKAPVIISAGALLKDNQTGKVLAQLKIKNITANRLKAAKVKIVPFDTAGDRLAEETEYQYLDLDVKRDDMFGQKTPIVLPDNRTRAFEVSVTSVVFSDNNVWNIEVDNWKPLKLPRFITEVFENPEMVKQYKIEYGKLCNFEVTEDRDILICSCGLINKADESKCHNCGCELQALKNPDIEKLEEDCNKRLEWEKEQKALERERKAKEEAAKQKRNKLIAVASVAVFFVIAIVSYLAVRDNQYKTALEFIESKDYVSAIGYYKDLGKYRDSEEQLKEATYLYANQLYANEQYRSAIQCFEELEKYKDSEEKLKDSKKQLINFEFKGILKTIDTGSTLLNDYYVNSNQVAVAEKFKQAEVKLKEYENDLSPEQMKIYNNIQIMNKYSGNWEVVSGNCTLGYETEGYSDIKVNNFNIYLNYWDSLGLFIHTVPKKNSNTVYTFGGYFVFSGKSNELFINSEYTKLKDNKIYRISDIKNNRITITEYQGKKATDKLVLEKISDTYQ